MRRRSLHGAIAEGYVVARSVVLLGGRSANYFFAALAVRSLKITSQLDLLPLCSASYF